MKNGLLLQNFRNFLWQSIASVVGIAFKALLTVLLIPLASQLLITISFIQGTSENMVISFNLL